MPLRELAKRLGVAVVGIPIAMGLVHLGGWPLAGALAVMAALGAREFFRLGGNVGIVPLSGLGIVGASGLVLLSGWALSYERFAPPALAVLLFVFAAGSVAAIWLRWPEGKPLTAVSFTLAGVLYTGGCLSFVVLLRHLPDVGAVPGPSQPFHGQLLLLLPLAVTWTGDSAAYFFGYLLGKRKLIPAVSPGKTVTGSVSGLLVASVAGGLMAWFFLRLHSDPAISGLLGAGIGLILGGAAQLGDLVESVFKRDAGLKDSGGIFPGHGGILDRFDALFFTIPAAYVLVRIVEVFQ